MFYLEYKAYGRNTWITYKPDHQDNTTIYIAPMTLEECLAFAKRLYPKFITRIISV